MNHIRDTSVIILNSNDSVELLIQYIKSHPLTVTIYRTPDCPQLKFTDMLNITSD